MAPNPPGSRQSAATLDYRQAMTAFSSFDGIRRAWQTAGISADCRNPAALPGSRRTAGITPAARTLWKLQQSYLAPRYSIVRGSAAS